MEECIFCKISNGEIPCAKIWEDDKYISFLDINPVTEGMSLVIPKDHKNSDIFKNDQETINEIMQAAKEVSKKLEGALNIERVGVIFEGIEVDHLHVKLIPIKGGEYLKSILESNFPKPNSEELYNLASKIKETI
jgi:diadenosine tetraphosphate (Ap4A) HIT family hydrolase